MQRTGVYHTLSSLSESAAGRESSVRGSCDLLQLRLKQRLGDGRPRTQGNGRRGAGDGAGDSARHRAGKSAKEEHFCSM